MDIHDFICPITQQLFNKPVLLNDGFFYEKDAIDEWLIDSNISPMTGKQLNHKYYNECFWFNKLLKKMMETNPELKKEQYIIPINLNFINKTSDEIYVYLQENNISMCEININFNITTKLFKNDNLVKYLIDNAIETKNTENLKLIHFICRYSTPELIKYIIDKGANTECSDNNGWKPIHYICRYSTPELIKYIIDKGANTECCTNDGWKPIHIICRLSTPELIKYIIDKGVDLECADIYGWKPIHIICRLSTPELLKYIIDKGANKTDCIKKFNGTDVNYNCIDLINKRSDIVKKNEYISLFNL